MSWICSLFIKQSKNLYIKYKGKAQTFMACKGKRPELEKKKPNPF